MIIYLGAPNTYGKYYGDSGNNKAYPEYNTTRVLTSLTNLAINHNVDSQISTKTIKKLRKESEIRCEEVTQFPNCSSLCLFDIHLDPCETVDVSSAFPEVSYSKNLHFKYINKFKNTQSANIINRIKYSLYYRW